MLKGYWLLNEESGDALDHSGNENHGTVDSGVSRSSTGLLGENAYSFDGNGVAVQDSDAFDFSGEVTITAWINSRSVGGSDHKMISWKGGGWDRKGWFLSLHDGGVRWQLGDGSTEEFTDFTASIQEDRWHHVVARWKNGSMNIWVDAEKSPEDIEWSNGLYSSSEDLMIGKGLNEDGNEDLYFPGRISEVRLYDRALTEGEIHYIYSVGRRGLQTTSIKSS